MPEFRDWNIEADGLEVLRGDHEAHVIAAFPPSLAGAIQMPDAVHSQVRAEEQLSRKFNDQMLAGGTHALDGPAANRRLIIHTGEPRQDGLEPCDHFAGQRAVERARRAKDRVAFRHCCILSSRAERGTPRALAGGFLAVSAARNDTKLISHGTWRESGLREKRRVRAS